MNIKEMSDQEFGIFVLNSDLSELNLTNLKVAAKRLGIVGVDKYRLDTRDELFTLVSEKVEEMHGEQEEVVETPEKVEEEKKRNYALISCLQHGIKFLNDEFLIAPYDELPMTKLLKGIYFYAKENADGNICGFTSENGLVHVPVNTPIFKDVESGLVIPIKFIVPRDKSPDYSAALYSAVQRKFYKDRVHAEGHTLPGKLILGDPKSGTFYGAPIKYWESLFKQPLFIPGWYDKNPHKTWRALCGPSDTVIHSTEKEKLRILLIPEQYDKPDYLPNDPNILGYKFADGRILVRGVRVRSLTKENILKAKKRNKAHLTPWKYADPVSQVRTIGMTAMKGTLVTDESLFYYECERLGIDPDKLNIDAIATMDIIKSHKYMYKAGDIIELDVMKNLRIIRMRMSEWQSSVGAQAVRLDPDSLRLLLAEKGTVERTKLLARAASTWAIGPIIDIFTGSDVNNNMEDSYTMYAKLVFGSMYNPDVKDWITPGYNAATLKARFLKFYQRNVLKTKVAPYAYYAQSHPLLNKMRDDDFIKRAQIAYDKQDTQGKKDLSFDMWKKTRECRKEVPLRFFCLLPNRRHFHMLVESKHFINLGRQPMVGPSNLMGFEVAGFHGGRDCIYVCSMALACFYGDEDGDSLTVCPSLKVKFPTMFVPPAMKEAGGDEKIQIGNMDEYFEKVLVPITKQVFRSATSVGLLDNMGRRIISHRASAGQPCSLLEKYDIGYLIENGAIKGLKHAGSEVDIDLQEYMIEQWGVNNPRNPKQKLRPPKVSLAELEYQILRKDIGLNADIVDEATGNVIVYKTEANCFDRLIQHMQRIEFSNHFGFDDVLRPLVGIKCEENLWDAERIRKYAAEDYKAVITNYGKGQYSWRKLDMTDFIHPLIALYKQKRNFVMREYRNNATARRDAFGKLNNEFKATIENRCLTLFGSLSDPKALAYQRHCFLYVVANEFGYNKGEQRSRSLGLAFLFNLVEVVLFFAERWDRNYRPEGAPDNPYIPLARKAILAFEEKVHERHKAVSQSYYDQEDDIY